VCIHADILLDAHCTYDPCREVTGQISDNKGKREQVRQGGGNGRWKYKRLLRKCETRSNELEACLSVLADFPVLRIHLDQPIVDLTQRLCIQRARVPDQYLSKYTVILWLFIGGIFCPRILNAKDFSNQRRTVVLLL